MNNICMEHSLAVNCYKKYRGIAYDGCKYYMTIAGEKNIMIMDCDFDPLDCIETCRVYTEICYDMSENCFWATVDNCFGAIFKLNACLQEIDRVIPSGICCNCSQITGISYCCGTNCLIFSAENRIFRFDKKTNCTDVIYSERANVSILALVCAYPFVIYYGTKDSKQFYVILSPDGCRLEEHCVPNEFWIESALLYPCKDCCGVYHLYLLASKHCCYPYLIDTCLGCCLSKKICSCNELLCDQCCHSRECKHHNACNDVLESIALQEASIAHILNAEGEKLQKIIAQSDNVNEILAVNESVQKTIVRATHLEQVLFDKLDSLNEHCGICQKPCCHSCKECCDITPCKIDGGKYTGLFE